MATYREAVKAAPDTVEVLKPAIDLSGLRARTQADAKAILERFVTGELAADAPILKWARNSLARLLAGGNYADRVRAGTGKDKSGRDPGSAKIWNSVHASSRTVRSWPTAKLHSASCSR